MLSSPSESSMLNNKTGPEDESMDEKETTMTTMTVGSLSKSQSSESETGSTERNGEEMKTESVESGESTPVISIEITVPREEEVVVELMTEKRRQDEVEKVVIETAIPSFEFLEQADE